MSGDADVDADDGGSSDADGADGATTADESAPKVPREGADVSSHELQAERRSSSLEDLSGSSIESLATSLARGSAFKNFDQIGRLATANLAANFAQGPAFKNFDQIGKLATANLAANFAQGPAFKNFDQIGKLATANLAANFAQGPAFKNFDQIGKLATANLAANFAQGSALKNLQQAGSASPSWRLARAVSATLTQQVDVSRRARLVDSAYLSSLVDSAVAAEPDFDPQVTLSRTIKRVAAEPLPLAEDDLLTDDDEAVEAWVGLLVQQFMQATGLSERDLLEDAVATLAYSSVLALAIALLVNFPMTLLVAGMTGYASKDAAAYASRLARRGFRLMNEL